MKTLVIHNPRSGHGRSTDEVASAAARLSAAGWQVDLLTSQDIEELSTAAHRAVATGVEAVVVAGGDGTLNLIVQALAHKDVALGVLPCGTANAWAKEFGIPLDLQKATDILLNGEITRVDLGMANDRYFLFIASIGFDALVVREVDAGTKRRLGVAAYVVAAIAKTLELRGEEVSISADDVESRYRVLMIAVSNLKQYGGLVEIAPQAVADDGLLDVSVFRGQGVAAATRHALRVLLRLHARNAEAEIFRVARLKIEARNPLSVELDGDYFGTTPVEISVQPGALRAILPPGAHKALAYGSRGTSEGNLATGRKWGWG